jgi:hypothetical protein
MHFKTACIIYISDMIGLFWFDWFVVFNATFNLIWHQHKSNFEKKKHFQTNIFTFAEKILTWRKATTTHSPTPTKHLYLNYLYNNIFSTHVIFAVGVTLVFIFKSIFIPTTSSIFKRETLFECMVIIPTLKALRQVSIFSAIQLREWVPFWWDDSDDDDRFVIVHTLSWIFILLAHWNNSSRATKINFIVFDFTRR